MERHPFSYLLYSPFSLASLAAIVDVYAPRRRSAMV